MTNVADEDDNVADEDDEDEQLVVMYLPRGAKGYRRPETDVKGPFMVLVKVPPHLQLPPESRDDSPALRRRRSAYEALMRYPIVGCPVLHFGRNLVPADYWAYVETRPTVAMAVKAGHIILSGLATEAEVTEQEAQTAHRAIAKLESQINELKERFPSKAARKESLPTLSEALDRKDIQ